MKKCTLILVSCLLLAFTGCDNDEPATVAETSSQTEATQEITEITEAPATTAVITTVTKQPETTEKAMEVTMDNIDEIFSFNYPEENYYENLNRLFLFCFYDKPSEMDLRTILYHGLGKDYNYSVDELSEDEILAAGLNTEGVEHVGAIKIPKDKHDDYLMKKTGLKIDEFDNIDMKLKYNEQYDAYYGYRSTDTILQPLEFESVEMNGDVYIAVYKSMDMLTCSEITCQVQFKVNDGILQFISNKQILTQD